VSWLCGEDKLKQNETKSFLGFSSDGCRVPHGKTSKAS